MWPFQGMMLKRHLKGFKESKLEEMSWPQVRDIGNLQQAEYGCATQWGIRVKNRHHSGCEHSVRCFSLGCFRGTFSFLCFQVAAVKMFPVFTRGMPITAESSRKGKDVTFFFPSSSLPEFFHDRYLKLQDPGDLVLRRSGARKSGRRGNGRNYGTFSQTPHPKWVPLDV